MPNFDEFKANKKLRAWDKDIIDQLRIEQPYVPSEQTIKKAEETKSISETSQRHFEDTFEDTFEDNTNPLNIYLKPDLDVNSKTHSRTHSKTDSKTDSKTSSNSKTHSKTHSRTHSRTDFNINNIGVSLTKILLFLYSLCKTISSRITPTISINDIVENCGITSHNVKKSIQRLKEKRLIIRHEYTSGRYGKSIYEIPINVWQELSNYENSKTHSRTHSKTDSKTNPPIVVSSINKLTTNSIHPVDNLPEDWKAINYEPIRHIGFSETQLLQIYATKRTTAKIVQESIDNFAFGLMHSAKTKLYTAPLNVIMGVLLKGGSWIEPSYHSPTAEPLKPIAEQKKEQEEDRERSEALFDRQYFKWFNELSNDELKQLFPDYDLSSNANQRFYYFEGTCRASRVEVFRKTKWIEIFNNIPD